MTHDPDRLPESMREAARDYNDPPALGGSDFDAMWDAIETQAFPPRFASPSAERRAVVHSQWWSARTLLPLAAALIVGVGIGRLTRPPAAVAQLSERSIRQSPDSVALPEPYQTTTSQYLGQTAALLVALPEEVQAGRADERFLGRAHDLLLTTRLLLDSPAAADPRMRQLLEDLELVLAQVARLQSDQQPAEMDLIRQALEQRDVLPRLRTAAADMSADD